MKNKSIILFFTLLMFNTFIFSQEIWDWQKCIEYAMQNNIQIKQNELGLQLNQSQTKQTKFNWTPTINAQSNFQLKIGNNYNFFENQYEKSLNKFQDYSINVNQNIFDGFATKKNIEKLQLDYKALELDNEVLKTNIQLQILTSFLNILNANEQYEQALTQQKSTQEQKQNLENLIEAGMRAERDIVDIKAQIANENATIVQLKNNIELTYLQLKNLLQLDLTKDIKIQIPTLPNQINIEKLSEVKTIYETALANRPEIKSSNYKILSAEKQIEIAKTNNIPTLSFIGNLNTFYSNQNTTSKYTFTNDFVPIGFTKNTLEEVVTPKQKLEQSKIPYFTQLNNGLSYAFGLNLNIPIYNKNQVKFAVQQAKINIALNKLNKEQTANNLLNTIQQAYIKTIGSIENYKAALVSFDAANQSYSFSKDRYEAGIINQLEMNLAKNNVLNAQSKLIQSKYEYIFNTKVLDFYEGKDIKIQ